MSSVASPSLAFGPADDNLTDLAIAKIRMDGATQPRDTIDNTVVIDYADAMNRGDRFPAPVVYYDGKHHWLADGFHRITAAKRLGLKTIRCEVHMGDKRNALLHSCGANSKHGLRRTNADKLRAVMKLLNDDEWGTWSDSRIADVCGVSNGMVASHRVHSINPLAQSPIRRVLHNGKERLVNTENINRHAKPAQEPPAAEVIPLQTPVEPQQRTAVNPIHEFARSLRASDIEFKQNVHTKFGPIAFETKDSIINVVPLLTAAAFREAFTMIVFQRLNHAPNKKAVIVGKIMDDAQPWVALAKHWKVEVKNIG